jgi:hypothetical protein
MPWCCSSSSKDVVVPSPAPVPVKTATAPAPAPAPVSVDVRVAQKPVMLKFRMPSDEDAPTINIPAHEQQQKQEPPAAPSFYYKVVRGLGIVLGVYFLAYIVNTEAANASQASSLTF